MTANEDGVFAIDIYRKHGDLFITEGPMSGQELTEWKRGLHMVGTYERNPSLARRAVGRQNEPG